MAPTKLMAPPKDLINLTEIPREEWVGLTIYHPMSQLGMKPYFRCIDEPDTLRLPCDCEDSYCEVTGETCDSWTYDVGVIEKVEWHKTLEEWDVLFKTDTCVLRYFADNLWVEK